MGTTRVIKSASSLLAIKNKSGSAIGVSGATVYPGKTKEVAAWVYSQDKFRSEELYALASRGVIEVSLDGLPLSAETLRRLDVPYATQVSGVQRLTTAELTPLLGVVPDGTVMFDLTLAALVTHVTTAGVPAWV